MLTERPAGLLRRIAALIYDLLILAAILIAATAIAMMFTGGNDIPSGTAWYQLYLFSIVAVYFVISWWRGGQTIGMVAWRLRLESASDRPISIARLILRFAFAAGSLGTGLLYSLADDKKRALHDIIAGTQVTVRLPA